MAKKFDCYPQGWEVLNALQNMAPFDALVVSFNTRTEDKLLQAEIHLHGKLVAKSDWS